MYFTHTFYKVKCINSLQGRIREALCFMRKYFVLEIGKKKEKKILPWIIQHWCTFISLRLKFFFEAKVIVAWKTILKYLLRVMWVWTLKRISSIDWILQTCLIENPLENYAFCSCPQISKNFFVTPLVHFSFPFSDFFHKIRLLLRQFGLKKKKKKVTCKRIVACIRR